ARTPTVKGRSVAQSPSASGPPGGQGAASSMAMSTPAADRTSIYHERGAKNSLEMAVGALAAGSPGSCGGGGCLGLATGDAPVLDVQVGETHQPAAGGDGAERERLQREDQRDEAPTGQVEEHEGDDQQHQRHV